MKNVLIILVVVLLGAGLYWKFVMPKSASKVVETSSANATTVELKDFAFNPKTVTVKAGSSVKFTNKDLVGHSVTSDDKKFDDSGILNQGESSTVTFQTAGTYSFHCTPHPNMKMTVVVE